VTRTRDTYMCSAESGGKVLCEYGRRIIQDIQGFRCEYFGVDRTAGMDALRRAHYKAGKLVAYVANIQDEQKRSPLPDGIRREILAHIESGIVNARETAFRLEQTRTAGHRKVA
jgi:hypothetical protein